MRHDSCGVVLLVCLLMKSAPQVGLSKGTSRHFVPAGGAGQVGRVENSAKVLQFSARSVSCLAFPWAMCLALDGRGEGAFAHSPSRVPILYRSFASL